MEAHAMTDIALIACARRKGAEPAPARELYTSPLFQLAAPYCDAACDCWFVLSARHGLVEPTQLLAPYDASLRGLNKAARAAWAAGVVGQLRERGLLGAGHRLQIHAGALYADPLTPLLRAEQPLRGLGIGRRLAWYRRQLAT